MRLFLILISTLLLSVNGYAYQHCAQQWACIEVKRQGKQLDFYLSNKKPYAITMTLDVDVENYQLQRSVTDVKHDAAGMVTKSLLGGQRIKVLSYLRTGTRHDSHFDYDYEWVVGRLTVKHQDDYLYRLPYGPDNNTYVVQGFNGGYSHRGLAKYSVDFAMPEGSKVYAARGGMVVDIESSHDKGGASRRLAPYANFVVIEHDDGSTGEYYHLQKDGVSVAVGDKVERGQLIGLSGNTGFTSLPHLHFAVYKALPHGNSQSLPFRFVTAKGVVSAPRHGQQYQLAAEE